MSGKNDENLDENFNSSNEKKIKLDKLATLKELDLLGGKKKTDPEGSIAHPTYPFK